MISVGKLQVFGEERKRTGSLGTRLQETVTKPTAAQCTCESSHRKEGHESASGSVGEWIP